MRTVPLPLAACKAGLCGKKERNTEKNYSIYDAGFLYLFGSPDNALIEEFGKSMHGKEFVCMSEEWKSAIFNAYPKIRRSKRYLMMLVKEKANREAIGMFAEKLLPEFKLEPFTEKVYDAHIFGHAKYYATYEKFMKYGSGAIMTYKKMTVASSASVFTVGSDIALTYAVLPEFGNKQLDIICAAATILDCLDRNMKIQWDVAGKQDRQVAESFGFRFLEEYESLTFRDKWEYDYE